LKRHTRTSGGKHETALHVLGKKAAVVQKKLAKKGRVECGILLVPPPGGGREEDISFSPEKRGDGGIWKLCW